MIKRILVILILLAPFAYIEAQTDDLELWTGLKLEKKLSEKFGLANETQLRLNNNINSYNNLFSEIELEYRLMNRIRLSGCYRLSERYDPEEQMFSQHRFNIDLTLRQKMNRLLFSLRNRFQTRYSRINTDEMGKVPENTYRAKFTVSYDIKKNSVTPSIAGEIFYQLSPYEERQLNKFRVRAGLNYEVNNDNEIGIFYMIEQEVYVPGRITAYIFGIRYSFSL